MSGVIIEPFTSIEAAERNFQRLNEAVVALQGGSIAIENIEGYENLTTKNDLEEAIETVRYAVGDVHITEDTSNPEQKFGYGKWKLISRGRVLTGIDAKQDGDSTDYQPDQDFQTAGQEGGEKEHTLTVEELPAHNHNWKSFTVNADGGNYATGMFTSDSRWGATREKPTENAGADKPHNNLQPYYCVYMWRRTA